LAADYSRIHRLLKILTLIQGESGWTAQALADECGTSTRTIYRDLRMLEGAGIPYFFDEEKNCYQVRRDFFMPPVSLGLDESLALIALSEHIGGKEQIPLTKPAARAIAKIRSLLPGRIRDEIERLDKHIAIQLARAGPCEGIADVYDHVRNAIARKRVLHCNYESIERSRTSKAEADGFEFRPYTLFFSQRAWYVIGHHGGRDAVRCLKLNRFIEVQPTKKPYAIPDDFSVDDHLGNAWRMIRGNKTYNVELSFDAEFAETIADTHWHETQEVAWQEDGTILFRCRVDGLDEIVWWILSMGPHCVIRKPAGLARRVQQLASATASQYERSKPARKKKAT
jgi:proteasome accessory factor B